MPGSYAPAQAAITPPGRAVDAPSDSVDSRVVVTEPSAPAGTAPRRIRVAFADDSYLIREAIALLLSREPRIAVVALCEDGDALRAAIDAEHPDVVLTDIRMPPSGDAEGIVLAKSAACHAPGHRGRRPQPIPRPRHTAWRCWRAAMTGAATCSRNA